MYLNLRNLIDADTVTKKIMIYLLYYYTNLNPNIKL
jgi:hypothetical protein